MMTSTPFFVIVVSFVVNIFLLCALAPLREIILTYCHLSNGTRKDGHSNIRRTRFSQRLRGFTTGCAGRKHIIDQENSLILNNRFAMWRNLECAAHVAPPGLRRGHLALARRRTDALQGRRRHRFARQPSQRSREFSSLVVAPPPEP